MAAKRKKTSELAKGVDRIAEIAKRFDAWQPASKVLTSVRAVPTVFPQLNVATRVGGWPIERPTLIHGPSNEGKTLLALGLEASFLRRHHFAHHVDAEMTTSIDWCRELMGEVADSPLFFAERPETMEDTVESVRQFARKVGQVRDEGLVDEDTSAIFVVDSLRKLVPERMWDKLQQEGLKDGIDALKGMAGMYKAAMTAAWMDELVPLLYRTHTAMVIISRERQNAGAGPFEPEWLLSGGKAQFYESSLVIRVTRAGWVKDGSDVVGERFRLRIYKTKVGGKEGKFTDCYFHSSNGTKYPLGFDPARDVFEMAEEAGAVKRRGKTFFTADGESIGVGREAAISYVREHADVLQHLEQQSLEGYKPEEGDIDDAGDE